LYCCIKHSQWHKQEKLINDGKGSNRTWRLFLIRTVGKCSVCGLSEWQNKPISLELDHISGNWSDNSPNNLRLLCPNCHSQTHTYKAKNKGNGRPHRRTIIKCQDEDIVLNGS
jgi:hypothetical protein